MRNWADDDIDELEQEGVRRATYPGGTARGALPPAKSRTWQEPGRGPRLRAVALLQRLPFPPRRFQEGEIGVLEGGTGEFPRMTRLMPVCRSHFIIAERPIDAHRTHIPVREGQPGNSCKAAPFPHLIAGFGDILRSADVLHGGGHINATAPRFDPHDCRCTHSCYACRCSDATTLGEQLADPL